MRLVKPQTHTSSYITTSRSHHGPPKPVDFIAVDGEGMMIDGEHKYVLFGVGERQIENPDGLHWTEVFQLLYESYLPNTAFVGFYLGYDFTQIIKTMTEDRARMLLTQEGRIARQRKINIPWPHPVECGRWQFDILGMKRLKIRPKLCDCPYATCKCKSEPWLFVNDVGSYFQTSFLKVIDPKGWPKGTAVVTPKEYADIEGGKSRRGEAVLDDDMRRYNRLENDVLVRVMKTLDTGFHAIDIHLSASKWFGPGQAAQTWMQQEKVPTREQCEKKVPPWFLEAARMSYYGGWFEQFIHGIIPGTSHEYDICSAYPHIIRQLPCLLHGRYTYGEGLPTVQADDLCLVKAQVWSPSMPDGSQPIGTMLHRDPKGRILRPLATEGWFWWDELMAAEQAGLVKRLTGRTLGQQVTQWVKYSPCDCPPPLAKVEDLYQKRLAVGKQTPLGKAARLVYNSEYGKFAQSVGMPLYGNPVYASRITSECRRMILDAIATHPDGMYAVSMVATDAVYFMSPHPTLPVSSALGEWEHQTLENLTLFKPGVYWHDETRRKIIKGEDPNFKSRGFKAADFLTSITNVDDIFWSWNEVPNEEDIIGPWPVVDFTPSFSMTTALQALQRNDWPSAGRVETSTLLTQAADPSDKRTELYRDSYQGRTIYRSKPHRGMCTVDGHLEWIPSFPYAKRFGMDDPWSDEYRSQLGETQEGLVADVLAWILAGER